LFALPLAHGPGGRRRGLRRICGEHAMAKVHATVMQKSYTTTPQMVGEAVAALCAEISPNTTPVYVPVAPKHGYVSGNCFFNVAAHVRASGGEAVNGWILWEWPGVFLEAEHHAVWQAGDELMDVTPHPDGETRILFLPDPARPLNMSSLLMNVRRPLSRARPVSKLIDLVDTYDEVYRKRTSIDGRPRTVGRERAHDQLVRAIMTARADLILHVAAKVGSRSNPCFCGSQRTYGDCCRRYLKY